jgi:hemoglobin
MLKKNLLAKLILPLFAFFVFSATVTSSAPTAMAQEKSLYDRLGGYDAVAKVVDEFIAQLGKDKQLSRFLVGLSDDSKKKLRQHVVDQFCQATGGPCIYNGREMKTAHTGLKISESDWDIGAKALVSALDKYKVPQKEKDEVVAFVMTLKKDIVGL